MKYIYIILLLAVIGCNSSKKYHTNNLGLHFTEVKSNNKIEDITIREYLKDSVDGIFNYLYLPPSSYTNKYISASAYKFALEEFVHFNKSELHVDTLALIQSKITSIKSYRIPMRFEINQFSELIFYKLKYKERLKCADRQDDCYIHKPLYLKDIFKPNAIYELSFSIPNSGLSTYGSHLDQRHKETIVINTDEEGEISTSQYIYKKTMHIKAKHGIKWAK